MGTIQIDVSDREALTKTDFPVMEPGVYDALIKKTPKVIACAPPSTNKMVKVEMEVTHEETKYVVFDQLVLPYPGCHQFMHAKLYQFSTCFGVEVDDSGNIDLETFAGAVGSIRVGQAIQEKGRNQGKPYHFVNAYLFKQEKEADSPE